MSHRNIFYYDSRDNLSCVRDPDLGLTYYTYDAGSRMTSVKNPFGEVTYYEYRLDGQVSKKTLGNGCVTYYEFDSIGRTAKVDNRQTPQRGVGDMSVISSFAYERDAVGNPLSIEREDGYTVYYDYDAKHQLTGERHLDGGEVYAWEWDYDAAGNREYQVFNGEATYYEYNAANELLTETTGGGSTYYDYDACGNTTVKQEPTGTTYYHWDHENLMTRLDLPDGGHSYFAYDADSKRVSKRDGDSFSEFIYQGPDMLALQMERDEAGETRVRYTMGSGLEAMRRASNGISSGDSSFYHFDWLGSTFELTDESQAVTDEYLYNAWGEVLERTGTTENPHQWVGKARYYARQQTASYFIGLRRYVARPGRFLSLDPIREPSSRFVYTRNMPVSVTDPTGARCCLDLRNPLSELSWQESRWVHKHHAWCYYDVWLDLNMYILIQKGSSSDDCFALQWFKGYERDPVLGLKEHGEWTLDAGRPYPHFDRGMYAVIWSDRPGIADKPIPCALLGPHYQNLSFITCICSKHSGKVEPKPVVCFEWEIGFRVDPPQCQLTAYKYSLPKPTAFHPEPCQL